jgi:RimJ/RimL family protein N-acetyltransferase/acyl carrier protein
MPEPMPWEDFRVLVAQELKLSPDLLRAGARLEDDLGLDSLQFLRVCVLLDELGAEVPEDMMTSIKTVGDFFDHYVTRVSAEPSASGAAARARTDAVARGSAVSEGPPMTGRHVRLSVIDQRHLGYLYELSLRPEVGYRWRFRGLTPSPDEFRQSMWSGVLAQFAIETSAGKPIGLVQAFKADFRHGYAFLAILLEPSLRKRGWPLEAPILFLNYVFTNWSFRKLYAESLEFNLVQFSSAIGEMFEQEGCLRDHEFYDGRYWDMHVLSISRDTWDKVGPRLVRFATGGSRR